MIQQQCFTKDWLEAHGAKMGCRSHQLLEKSIVALQVLGYLSETGLPFQFKGGTSLLLRLNPIRRLSIDVDIVTQATPAELTAALDRMSRLVPLTGYEHDMARDRDLPPKKHFRIFYPSVVEPKTDHVLLDVLFDPVEAPHSEPVVINSPFIEPEREVRVWVPTVDSLLGDKLTAFAPHTIGILYHPYRKTDIVKQLFDVGVLFDAATDLDVAANVYAATHARQLKYRNANYSLSETLNDTIEAAYQITQLKLKGGVASDDGLLLHEGVQNLANHLVNSPFQHDEARQAAAKAAWLAVWIQRRAAGLTTETVRFDRGQLENQRLLEIKQPWLPLNRLKRINPEAFHYWFQAQQALNF